MSAAEQFLRVDDEAAPYRGGGMIPDELAVMWCRALDRLSREIDVRPDIPGLGKGTYYQRVRRSAEWIVAQDRAVRGDG